MDLSEEQKIAITGWVQRGDGLSEIQKALVEQFHINMTYMDVRFLLLDLGLNIHDKPEAKSSKAKNEEDVAEEDIGSTGGVLVDIDRIIKPGAIVSGTVVFSDGKSGSWSLDQMGRLALDMGDPKYKPTEEDIALFQQELKAALQKRGF